MAVVGETSAYAATPEDTETATTAWGDIQPCRGVYTHALTQEYRPRPDDDKPSNRDMLNKLPGWKEIWPAWRTVYSTCLQMAVRRIKQSESVLDSLHTRGYDVGRLKWKAPPEFRSIVSNQSGFDVDRNTDRAGHALVNLSKIGDFHLAYHRPLPEDGEIRQVILKKEKTGDWRVCIVVEYDPGYPAKPAVEDNDPEETVGIDLGITTCIHDSNNRLFESLDEQRDRERIDRATVTSHGKYTVLTTGPRLDSTLLGRTSGCITVVKITERNSHTPTRAGTTRWSSKIST